MTLKVTFAYLVKHSMNLLT